MPENFSLRFLGVRGTLPSTGFDKQRYGGNTSCVEVRCGEHVLLLDAGTGIVTLRGIASELKADILLSHTHIDHILGLAFLLPACRKDAVIISGRGIYSRKTRCIKPSRK